MEVAIEKLESARVNSLYRYRFNTNEVNKFNRNLESYFKAFGIEDYELITFEEAVAFLQGNPPDKLERVYFLKNKYRIPFTIAEMFDDWIDQQLTEDLEPKILNRTISSSHINITILD